MLYALVDKNTNEVSGTAFIKDTHKSDWSKKYLLFPKDASFGVRSPHQMKYENGGVRLATQTELDTYETEKEVEKDVREKEKILNTLGITEEDLTELKKLKP